MVGHWLELVATGVGPIMPWAAWATWMFQVIPLFFIVGGSANAGSWQRALRRGDTWSVWVRHRAQRLLTPLFPLVAFWGLLTPILVVAGLPRDLAQLASRVALVPTWFLGAYLFVIALVPLTWTLHRRLGAWVVLGFLGAAASIDLIARIGVPFVGDANVLFVWGGIHQLGYFWHDARLPRRPVLGLVWALSGLMTLLGLVALAGYPVSMVTLQPDAPNNASPPTLALFALGLAQLGLVLAAKRRVSRWLERPRVLSAVNTLGGVALTTFLWHMTAIVTTAAAAYAMGLWPEAPDVSAAEWATQPAWVVGCVLALVALVLVFRGSEQRRATRALRPSPVRTALGLVATLAGIVWIVRRGLYAPDTPWEISTVATATLLAGIWALDALAWRS